MQISGWRAWDNGERMRIVIEYCRIRRLDGVLAVVDRVCCDAVNMASARSIALVLAESRTMPQTPDLVRVLDAEGTEFFREAIEPPAAPGLFGRLDYAAGDSGE
ncbi:MAG: hypothetical protein WAU86_17455 [Oricola sp.]